MFLYCDIFPPGGFIPLNIKNSDAHEYAKKLAALTGKSLTEVVTEALKKELEKVEGIQKQHVRQLKDELDGIALHCASYPVLDFRSADEILGYDGNGIPN